jgi:hypothetical protein
MRKGVFLAFGLMALASCKSGDDVFRFTPADAAFVPDERPAGVTERYVSLVASSAAEGRIILDVVVTEVDELVSGIAVKLSYPLEFSKFIGCEDGSLFPPGKCFFAESDEGEVFLSRSITDIGQAVPVSGEQVIMSVEFLVFGVEQAPIVIEGQNLGGGDTSALLDIDGNPIFVQWFSGVLQGK